MSAPSSNGLVSTGVAKVLSTPSNAPRRWAISAQAAMSVIESSGLPGLSIHTSLVAGVIACSMFLGCEASIDSVTFDARAVGYLVQQAVGTAVDIAAATT